jgi:hypothetical protein
MKIGRAIKQWWWKRQRKIDIEILWPECKKLAPTLHKAKLAFYNHANNTPAWFEYYDRYALRDFIDKLS